MSKMHGRLTRVFIDGYDLSGDFNSFEPGYVSDVAEVSGFGDTKKKYVVGLADNSIRIGGLFNDAADQVHAWGSARVGSEVMVTAVWGTDVGKYGAGGTVNLSEYSVSSPIGGAVTTAISMVGGAGDTGVFEYIQTVKGLGPFEAAQASPLVTGDQSNAGFSGHLQLLSGSGTAILQSSTAEAGPTWTDRINFGSHAAPYAAYIGTYTGTAPIAYRVAFTGTGTGMVAMKRF